MDTGLQPHRELPIREINTSTDTRDILARARQQSIERGYDRFTIVDIDSHHTETGSWNEILEYLDSDVLRYTAKSFEDWGGKFPGLVHSNPGLRHQDVAGRIPHQQKLGEVVEDTSVPRDVVLARRAMEAMGVDYNIQFPTPFLLFGQHPQPEVAEQLSFAYNRWLTKRILPADKFIKAFIYLPFSDPVLSLKTVEEFAGCEGVVGFMVTSGHQKRVYHNSYAPLWRAIEESGKALGFHAGHNWADGSISLTNTFMGMHALSFVHCNIVHMTNWVLNGMPERFPKIKTIWIESGLAWVPYLMQRLDNEYMMRSSEAPLLKKRPSDYMREMFYSCQPMEMTDMDLLKATFKAINAETQLLYCSDWPHWDFDLPSVIYDLPFLTERAKRNILGKNACDLFGLTYTEKDSPKA